MQNFRVVLWMLESSSGKSMDSKQSASDLFDWESTQKPDLSRRLEGVKVSISSNTVAWLKGFCEHRSPDKNIDGFTVLVKILDRQIKIYLHEKRKRDALEEKGDGKSGKFMILIKKIKKMPRK